MWKLSTYCYAINGLVTFVNACAKGILSAVLWPLCDYCGMFCYVLSIMTYGLLRVGGNRVDLGYLVAIYSLGIVVTAMPLGVLTDAFRHRFTLIFSSSIVLVGSILWGNVMVAGGLPTLFVAQFVLGLGSGTLGVTRSYVVEQTAPEKHTYRLSRLSALQYGGFVAMPLLGSALYVAGGRISTYFKFALPTYLLSALTILCLILLYHPFVDIEELDRLRRQGYDPVPSTSSIHEAEAQQAEAEQQASTVAATADNSNLTGLPLFIQQQRQSLFYIMIALNFTTRGVLAIYDGQIAATLLDDYDLSELQVGLYISMAGLLGTVHFLFFKELWSRYHWTDYQLMFYGLLATMFTQSLVVIWGKQQAIPLAYVLFALFFVYGVGYPLTNSAVLGCFSKLQRTGKQAIAQGQFALYGSLARVVFPIISGYVVGNGDVETVGTFCLVILILAISLLGLVLYEESINYFTSLKEKAPASVPAATAADEGGEINNSSDDTSETDEMKQLLRMYNDRKTAAWYDYFSFTQWCWIGFSFVATVVSLAILLAD